MGCGTSTPKSTLGRSRGATQKRPEEPELNGKSKFLSCPVVGDILHPITRDRWFVIAFAPQNVYGLIIAARNVTNGVGLIVKDVTDPQLAKEKDEQSISMSWNLFFKAVASEIGRINRGGARAEFLPDGTLMMEIKIAIAGGTQARRTDLYRCTLTAVENSRVNVFRYLIEPIATYYCRKRTDLVDRPDPQRERTLGELEAKSHVQLAAIDDAKREIEECAPALEPLRVRSEQDRLATDEGLARSLLTRQVILEQSATPTIVVEEPFRTTFTAHRDPEGSLLPPEPSLGGKADVTVALYPASVSPSTPVMKALMGCEAHMSSVAALVEAGGAKTAEAAMYCIKRFVDFSSLGVPEANVAHVVEKVAALYASHPKPFYGPSRVLAVLGCMLTLVCSLGESGQAAIAHSPMEWLMLWLAAFAMDVDHPGMQNDLLRNRRAFISTLYSDKSPAERHAVAVVLQQCRECKVATTPESTVFLSNVVVATDGQMRPSIEEIARARSNEIVNFARQPSDRAVAAGMLLKTVDLLVVNSEHGFAKVFKTQQRQALNEEKELSDKLALAKGGPPDVTTLGEAVETLLKVFPSLPRAVFQP